MCPVRYLRVRGRLFAAQLSTCLAGLTLALGPAAASTKVGAEWAAIMTHARGQIVYFNAWGGDASINRYLDWAAHEIERRHGVRLVHVKVVDIAEAVMRIQAERTAGRERQGSVDLLWINGENFAMLRSRGLLFGPWSDQLPNSALIDLSGNPTTGIDFTLPTAGYEVAWGTSRFTLFYEATAVAAPPDTPAALLAWIEAHPGRFTYPRPPAFLGTSFLKQLLLALLADPGPLQAPVGADFEKITAPLWSWLDRAHSSAWRKGRVFPVTGPDQRRLLGDGEIDWAMSFNPAEANRAIRSGELPVSTRALHFRAGVLANSHFLAIPYNASATEGARVVANFLLSPEAQLRKADEAHWGDPTVLAIDRMEPVIRERFARLSTGPALPPPPGRLLAEPHPSWTAALESAWANRYGAQ